MEKEEPDYGDIDLPDYISDVNEDIIETVPDDDYSVDVLSVNQCRDEEVLDIVRSVSKLSAFISNIVEGRALRIANREHGDELPANVEWVLNDTGRGEKYPDLALVDTEFDPPSDWIWPGIEIKVWCPLATEMTSRFKKGQSILQEFPSKISIFAWVPEQLVYGTPKFIGTWTGDALDVAEARDEYWHQPPVALIEEPDFSPDRLAHLQHTNVERRKWDGSDEELAEARQLMEEIDLAEDYSTDEEYQEKVDRLISDFNYKKDSNWRKLARVHHASLDDFIDRVEGQKVQGNEFSTWEGYLDDGNKEPFQNLFDETQSDFSSF